MSDGPAERQPTLRVQIRQAAGPPWCWYYSRAGEVFEVVDWSADYYELVDTEVWPSAHSRFGDGVLHRQIRKIDAWVIDD